MPGLIANVVAVIIGGLLGLFIRGGLSVRFKSMVTNAIGLSCLFIGASGAFNGLLSGYSHPILFILSLVIGGLFGEFIDLDARIHWLGMFIERRLGKEGFAKGFVTASLFFCVGSMAIIGTIEAALMGNYNVLFAKSALDGITGVVLAASHGFGVVFAAATVFVYQGLLFLLAGSVAPFMTADAVRELSIVGGILIFAIGIDMLGIKRFKVANFLPALFVPVVFYAVIERIAT